MFFTSVIKTVSLCNESLCFFHHLHFWSYNGQFEKLFTFYLQPKLKSPKLTEGPTRFSYLDRQIRFFLRNYRLDFVQKVNNRISYTCRGRLDWKSFIGSLHQFPENQKIPKRSFSVTTGLISSIKTSVESPTLLEAESGEKPSILLHVVKLRWSFVQCFNNPEVPKCAGFIDGEAHANYFFFCICWFLNFFLARSGFAIFLKQ